MLKEIMLGPVPKNEDGKTMLQFLFWVTNFKSRVLAGMSGDAMFL